MSLDKDFAPHRWNNKTGLNGFLLILIVVLALRLTFRSQQIPQFPTPVADNSPLGQLEASIAAGDMDKIKLLLKQKLDITALNRQGRIWDRIAFAPQTADGSDTLSEKKKILPQILQLLLEYGADPNSKCSNGVSLIAATRNQPQIIKMLLAHGAKADTRDLNGANALFNYTHDPETMRLLIAAGADTEARGYMGTTLLMAAAQLNKKQTIQFLLDRGARVQDRDHEGKTPLLWAAQFCSREIVGLMVERGADIHAKDREDRTALNYAVDNPDNTVCDLFLKKGVRYRHQPTTDATRLFAFVNTPKWGEQKLPLLVRCGVNINLRDTTERRAQNPTGNTALIQAALMQNQPVLDQIPRRIDAPQERRAQLVRAIKDLLVGRPKFTEVAELFLKNGADPNMANFQGWTPLLAATANNNVPLVKLLLAYGADVHKSLPGQITPLRIAQSYGYTEIERLLREKGE